MTEPLKSEKEEALRELSDRYMGFNLSIFTDAMSQIKDRLNSPRCQCGKIKKIVNNAFDQYEKSHERRIAKKKEIMESED